MAVGMSLDLMDRGQILQIHQKVGAISRAQIGTEARRPLCLSSPRYEYILSSNPSMFRPPSMHRSVSFLTFD